MASIASLVIAACAGDRGLDDGVVAGQVVPSPSLAIVGGDCASMPSKLWNTGDTVTVSLGTSGTSMPI
jgi:hypothetical protein